jgi:hypothetical protein
MKRVRYGGEVWSPAILPVGAPFASSMSPERTQTVSDQARRGSDRLRPRSGSRGAPGHAWPERLGGAASSPSSQVREGSEDRYTDVVGLLVPRQDAFDERRTLAVFESSAGDIAVELPRDLPQIGEWPMARLDSDRYQHRVALAIAGGGYELLQYFCADDGRGHDRPGHHSWGDSGHQSEDLAYSLLCVRCGSRFTPGWRVADPPLPAMLFPGLFEVIARLSRGHTWRMKWDSLLNISTERNDR